MTAHNLLKILCLPQTKAHHSNPGYSLSEIRRRSLLQDITTKACSSGSKQPSEPATQVCCQEGYPLEFETMGMHVFCS